MERKPKFEEKEFFERDFKLWNQAESEVVKALGGSMMIGLDEESRAKYYPQIFQRYNELRRQLGIKPATQAPTEQQIELPSQIKTTTQAIQWLKQQHGMTEEQAINWIKGQ